MLATTIGWLVGGFFMAGIAFLVTGFTIGAAQWAILYQRLPKAWRWFLASGLGWLAGGWVMVTILPASFDFLAGLVAGLGMGIAQWLLLRREVRWAGWWTVVSALAWFTGMWVLPGAILTGVVAGALSGVALILLFRLPRASTG